MEITTIQAGCVQGPRPDGDVQVYVDPAYDRDPLTGALGRRFHLRAGCHGATRATLMSRAVAERRLQCEQCRPYVGGSITDEWKALRDLFTSDPRRREATRERAPDTIHASQSLRGINPDSDSAWTKAPAGKRLDDSRYYETERPRGDGDVTVYIDPAYNKDPLTTAMGRRYHYRRGCQGARQGTLLSRAIAERRVQCEQCRPYEGGSITDEWKAFRDLFTTRTERRQTSQRNLEVVEAARALRSDPSHAASSHAYPSHAYAPAQRAPPNGAPPPGWDADEGVMACVCRHLY
eukprot:tig00001067_g6785.t1